MRPNKGELNMQLNCDCKDYKEGKNILDGITTLAYTHGVLYTAKQFVYCPWCGKKLIDKDEAGKGLGRKHG